MLANQVSVANYRKESLFGDFTRFEGLCNINQTEHSDINPYMQVQYDL